MAKEQERLDKKKGVVTSAATSGNGTSGIDKLCKQKLWIFENFWTILLVIVGLVVFYFGLYESKWENPSLRNASGMVWSHWFWVLVLAGILYFLAGKVDNASATKMLRGILVSALLAFFIILPAWFGIVDWYNNPKSSQRSEIPLASVLPQNAPNIPWAWHMEQSKWPRVLVPPHGDSVHVPGIFGGHIVWGGSGFKVHVLYSDGRECVLGNTNAPCEDGNIVAGYAHNEGGTPLYASYAYARKGEK
ncbi:MAG: hypothetical protein V1711_02760 [bacterium]